MSADEKRILKTGSFVQLWKGLNFMYIIKIRERKMKSDAKCWTKISQEYLLHVIKPPPPLSPKLKHCTRHFDEHLILVFSPLLSNKLKEREPERRKRIALLSLPTNRSIFCYEFCVVFPKTLEERKTTQNFREMLSWSCITHCFCHSHKALNLSQENHGINS